MTNVMVVMTTTIKAWAGWWGQGCAVLVATTMTNAPRAYSHRQPHLTHEPTLPGRPPDNDHGSGGGGAWRARSEAAPSAAAARPRPARTRDITAFGGTDRANRPPKRPAVSHFWGWGAGWWRRVD